MKQLIAIGLSPNLERDDVRAARQALFKPHHYQSGSATLVLQENLEKFFPSGKIFLFNAGRSALLSYLQSLTLPPDSEILVQAFTCNAVINPILWAKLQPIYVDIDPATYNMSADDLERKLTIRSKVLIIQHTFGQSADLAHLVQVAKDHGLIVIEDCAHALGTRVGEKLLGTFGDAALFSFGRDKVISSVYGGAMLVNNPNQQAALRQIYQALPYPNKRWIRQQLLHPIITWWAVRTWYWCSFGRILFWCAQRLGIISLAVSGQERSGKKPPYFPARLPNALAALALLQFEKLERFNQHRQTIAAIYQHILKPGQTLSPSLFLRYPVPVEQPRHVLATMAPSGIILGDWYWSVIAPETTVLKTMSYQLGSCPVAEQAVQHVINLPTHIGITTEQAKQLCRTIEPYVHRSN